MTLDVAVLAAASVVMFGYGPVFALATRHRQRRRKPRLHCEWPRLQAAVQQARADLDARQLDTDITNETTPLHDRLVCEAIEKAEGWAS